MLTALLFLLVVMPPVLASPKNGEIQLKAEDALECPDLRLSPDQTASLNKLITKRRNLLARVKDDLVVQRTTIFGNAMGEVANLEAWRKKEDKEVRNILFSEDIRNVEKFSRDIAKKEEQVLQIFPTKDNPPQWAFSQAVAGTRQAAVISLLVNVPVPSPLFTIRKDLVEQNGDTCTLKVSLLKPSNRMLIGKKPDPTTAECALLLANDSDQLKTAMEKMVTKGGKLPETVLMPTLPSSFHIYVRDITIDGPGMVDYQDLGTSQVPPLPATPPPAQTQGN